MKGISHAIESNSLHAKIGSKYINRVATFYGDSKTDRECIFSLSLHGIFSSRAFFALWRSFQRKPVLNPLSCFSWNVTQEKVLKSQIPYVCKSSIGGPKGHPRKLNKNIVVSGVILRHSHRKIDPISSAHVLSKVPQISWEEFGGLPPSSPRATTSVTKARFKIIAPSRAVNIAPLRRRLVEP